MVTLHGWIQDYGLGVGESGEPAGGESGKGMTVMIPFVARSVVLHCKPAPNVGRVMLEKLPLVAPEGIILE